MERWLFILNLDCLYAMIKFNFCYPFGRTRRPSTIYIFCVIRKLLHKSRVYLLHTIEMVTTSFPYHPKKKNDKLI